MFGDFDRLREGDEFSMTMSSPLKVDANARNLWDERYQSPNNRKKHALGSRKNVGENA